MDKNTFRLKRRITGFILYLLFWIALFEFARIYFLAVQHEEASIYSSSTILKTFLYGIKLDISTACYLMLLPLLIFIPWLWFPGKWYKHFLKTYSFIVIAVISGIVVSDARIYNFWAYRLEFSSLAYIKDPADAAASLRKGEMMLYLIPFILVAVAFILLCNKIINRFMKEPGKVKMPVVSSFVTAFVIASLIIPIRGGLGTVPLNASSAYFSESLFPNHAALNVVWNIGHTSIYRKPVKNPYLFKESSKAMEDLSYLKADSGTPVEVITNQRPNIIVIIIESFGSYLVNQASPDTVVTPRFRELIKEGLYFSDIYATGSRTDKVIPAIISGYPNLPYIKILQEPSKSTRLPGLFRLLDSLDYSTAFWYGGDLDFANLNSYIRSSGFRKIITKDNFSPKECNSKWGVHDHILLDKLSDSLSAYKKPFACAVLTLSSHEPFEVPMKPVFTGNNEVSRFKNSALYTDSCIGDFISKARESEWWNNTLIVLMADHCRRSSVNIPVYSEEIFRIPLLWLGGALAVEDSVISRTGNQYDLPLMIANQLKLKGDFPFSKDLLSPGSKSFAFYSYMGGFAFITDTATAIYDLNLKGNIVERGKYPSSAESFGKSMLQTLFDDYLSR